MCFSRYGAGATLTLVHGLHVVHVTHSPGPYCIETSIWNQCDRMPPAPRPKCHPPRHCAPCACVPPSCLLPILTFTFGLDADGSSASPNPLGDGAALRLMRRRLGIGQVTHRLPMLDASPERESIINRQVESELFCAGPAAPRQCGSRDCSRRAGFPTLPGYTSSAAHRRRR